MKRISLLAGMLACFGFCAATSATVLTYLYEGPNALGTNPRGLYDFDLTSGLSTFRTPVTPGTTLPRLLSFDVRPTDAMVYGVSPTASGGQLGGLYVVDPDTGDLTFVGDAGNPIYTDISFDPTTGKLYGTTFVTPSEKRFLVEIDPSDGSSTNIGEILPFAGTGAAGLAFNEMGELYALFRPSHSVESTLYNISIADAATSVIGSSTVMNTPVDFAFVDGKLFVTDHIGKMFDVNTTNGSAVEVGMLIDSRGIGGVFVAPSAATIPEPAAFALLTLGLAGIGFTKKKA